MRKNFIKITFSLAQKAFVGGIFLLATTAFSNAQTLPRVLSDKDATLYNQIFDLQDDGNWRKADKLVKQLDNQILMGHVKYQRFMHPTDYRSTYPELHLWMKAYADHPGAEALYRLAITRHRSDWKPTPRPVGGGYLGGTGPGQPFFFSRPYKSKKARTSQVANEVAHAKRVIRRYLYRGQPTNASEYLAKDRVMKLLDKVEEAQLEEKIALSFFLYGKDKEAIEYANSALKKARKYVPHANWTAGLATWRQGNIKWAARYFGALSEEGRISGWTASRSAWWASRAFFKLGDPEKGISYLRKAAAFPRTFYGLLALRQLGVQKPFDWELPKLTQENLDWLSKIPAARRAIALSEAGQFYLAERELRGAFPSANPKLAPMLLSLSHQIGAPSVAMRMGLYLWEQKGITLDAAIYPIPAWKPADDFKVDRALIYAFMRQESGFYTRAESPAGAKGLMQLMPSTAAYLSGDSSLRNRKNRKLFSPDYNLQLGQKYLQYLMKHEGVGENLFHMTIAYNGGPGNLFKWKKRTKGGEDPLFFIEAMQSRETRSFIKRVLTNFWVYRHRLGQDLPALDEIAEGKWPQYHPLDNKDRKVADHARN
ncbi:MAG: lytic transglycosylase domain-containing protein [Sneathiella sp.]|nr:lytic transglycosylase domain-containing protein [Sneathiella sp.]